MKKTVVAGFLLAALFFAPNITIAASAYDGIWLVQGHNNYLTINERDGILVAVQLYNEPTGNFWHAFAGTLNGNSVRFNTLIGYANAVVDVNFTSQNTARAVQISCQPLVSGFSCADRNGTAHNLQRIW